MLKFPAVPTQYNGLRVVRTDDSPLGGGRCLRSLPQSKFLLRIQVRRQQQEALAAGCGNCGKGLSLQLGDRGSAFAQEILQNIRRKWNKSEIRKLPIYFHKEGQQFQYAWDGRAFFLEPVETLDPKVAGAVSIREFYQLSTRKILRTLRRTFVPEQVRPHYISYMKWKFLHRVLSSILQVQCTQAMLQAIGIGARRALPAAAGLNWVLKDGLGRLGRFAYSGALGSTFDSNLKRVRFSTSVLFSLSLGLEILTPYFPGYFLFLATVANVGKSIALAAYLATSSAIHKSFAIGDNLADIAAKGQVQTVVADNLGLALSCALSNVMRFHRLETLLLLVIFPILSGLDLFAIYHELQAVHLQTLNKVRLEIIVDIWFRKKRVPPPEEVSRLEGLQFLQIPGQQSKSMALRIGELNPSGCKPDEVLDVFRSQSQQAYALFRDANGPKAFFHQPGILLWLKEGFSPKDIITAALQVEYLRTMASSGNYISWTDNPENVELVNLFNGQSLAKGQSSENLQERWKILIARSRQQAVEEVEFVLTAMEESGWQTKHILLAPSERHTYRTDLVEN
ncbi:hypothetical protein R1flu_017177 [Riccia fluitans]|uniref:Protein root UVB sensitive/RUS domain-containing protein n=1 Tax=Riccia fluitans TaxID=41844 RepID=A0ABD1XEA2_9MARC